MTCDKKAQFIGGPDCGAVATSSHLLEPPHEVRGRAVYLGGKPNYTRQVAIYEFRDGNFHFARRYEETKCAEIQ
jgi:hypothetical protein